MNAPLQFKIEQVALYPRDPIAAIALLTAMGLGEWARDHVIATGGVRGAVGSNEADLAFNYQGTRGMEPLTGEPGTEVTPDLIKPLELEVLHYTHGRNWMDGVARSVSHLGMHVTMDEMIRWDDFFWRRGIKVAQSVRTTGHTNPAIAETRRYQYTIYDTRDILGVDVKFIVRLNPDGTPQ